MTPGTWAIQPPARTLSSAGQLLRNPSLRKAPARTPMVGRSASAIPAFAVGRSASPIPAFPAAGSDSTVGRSASPAPDSPAPAPDTPAAGSDSAVADSTVGRSDSAVPDSPAAVRSLRIRSAQNPQSPTPPSAGGSPSRTPQPPSFRSRRALQSAGPTPSRSTVRLSRPPRGRPTPPSPTPPL